MEPAASSAGAEPSARAPADFESDHMDVDFINDDDDDDDDDDDEMGVGLIEDHCIHYYHQSIWNEFAWIILRASADGTFSLDNQTRPGGLVC